MIRYNVFGRYVVFMVNIEENFNTILKEYYIKDRHGSKANPLTYSII